MKNLLALLVTIIVFITVACNQHHPFYEDIEAFKKADKDSFPPAHAILFVGSSSFTKWTDVQQYFPDVTIINRGFGGSTLPDVNRYAQDIIYPYKPKQVVIYCGDNDIASGNVSATDVLQRFMQLFKDIRKNLPEASILYVSIKPSPSRAKYIKIVEDANVMIRQFLSSYPETDYVDVFHPMLDNNGLPKPEIFLEDSLHMNEKGYAIWKAAIGPHLRRY